MKHALVVDDEPAICRCFESLFAGLDCDVTVTASAESALELAEQNPFDVIVLDIRLPGMDGLSALSRLRELSSAPVLMMTAHGDLRTAVSAVEGGAFDYLPKPFDLDDVTRILKRALSVSSEASQPDFKRDQPRQQIVGDSPPMQHLFRQIALAAQHDESVLITGESGAGKELVAHAIHSHSARSVRSIVPVHLASLNEALLERELFGHTAGAYTGADAAQDGLITEADGGTLFLDEIGEAPASVQVKLLRTLETREYYRVGSSRSESSDFRVIAATNRPIAELRASDAFRADLFYRLATIHIHVPPLRERREDIPQLAQFLLNQNAANLNRQFSDDALNKLGDYSFPGNVRELKNVVLRAASASLEQTISADFVSIEADEKTSAATGTPTHLREAAQRWAAEQIALGKTDLMASSSEIVEQQLIAAVLDHCRGNRSAAANMLGIHRETLRDKISRFGLGEIK